MLQAEARAAFQDFLAEITQNHYALLRDAVNKLAVADCLLSLALVAVKGDYIKPEFTDPYGTDDVGDVLEIVNGRHPMVETLRSDPFVPNSVRLGDENPRSKIITGPNMGGKSSSVRMVALIAIMAQVGSYVPAGSVRMSMLDSVLVRMGGMSESSCSSNAPTHVIVLYHLASDELARGRSTFMVEMSETSDILLNATRNSLVILDELGRGTSTFDGVRPIKNHVE